MDVEQTEPKSGDAGDVKAMDVEDKSSEEKDGGQSAKEEEKEVEEEEPFQTLENPTRVTLLQLQHITFDADERYQPAITSVSSLDGRAWGSEWESRSEVRREDEGAVVREV